VVKVDCDVIARLGIDPASDPTIAAATTFVRHTGGWVVAEGIEDQRILTAVCDSERSPDIGWMLAGQGYLLGRGSPIPVPIDIRIDAFAHDWTDPERSPLPLPSKNPNTPQVIA
jgi:EAL domain-containing protein (putative c-di-GMP-specific phosphodiesterase class I)